MPIIPRPQYLVPGEGSFELTNATLVVAGSGAEQVATSFASRLRGATGLPLPVGNDGSTSNAIHLTAKVVNCRELVARTLATEPDGGVDRHRTLQTIGGRQWA